MDLYEWLGDNQLAHDIWQKKYQHNGETLDEFFDRISGGNEDVKKLIQEKKFCFGGRILANRGLQNEGRRVSLSNCYVLEAPEDNIESIYGTATKMARVFSTGGGVGVDISNLAPKGARINNAANTTSGAVSFMDTYSHVTDVIGAQGRRAALMISLDCHHPDLEEFIDIKTNPDKVTKANISVRITDDFMNAVEKNEEFNLEFYRSESDQHITKTVNAREVFMKLATNNWKMAEPGCLFWDRISDWHMMSEYPNFEYGGVNPCFTGNMKLLTADGYKSFEELCDTEFDIINAAGVISKSKAWCSGEKNTVKVMFANGRIIECTPNHIFMLNDGNECEAKDLAKKRVMPFINRNQDFDDTYIKLGFIQGDGELTHLLKEHVVVNVGRRDDEIRDVFRPDIIKEYSDGRSIGVTGYNDILRELRFSFTHLPERSFPDTYEGWSLRQKRSFLQGCYSANGSVINHSRVAYKTTCYLFANQLLEALKEFGIDGYITTNKPNKVTFKNGTYLCKQSYDVNICQYDGLIKFAENIGFYHEYKNEALTELLIERAPFVMTVKPNGMQKVYDFTEPEIHWGVVDGTIVHNCGEEPLPPYGACLLGSLNLSAFVTDEGKFDWDDFKNSVEIAVIALNEVLEEGLPLHPLEEQRKSVADWMQIGCGVMGLADMLIKMGIRYGSVDSLAICDQIAKTMATVAIDTSSMLAVLKGSFPKYDTYHTMKSGYFMEHASDPVKVSRAGLRNSQLLTIPPTGSIANLFGISGAIEPIYANSYTRKTESLHGKDTYYKVYTPIVEKYMNEHGLTNEKDLPDYFVTAKELNYKERIDMQAVWQKHIDASISSTVNLPNDITQDEVFDLYMYAWKKGLKGVTIYRDGCEREGILSEDKPSESIDEFTDEELLDLPRGMIETVPEGLQYRKYKLTTGCGQLYLFVGIDDYDNKIYDIYTATDSESGGGCSVNTTAVSRLISIAMRGGVPIEEIIKQLKGSGSCPSYLYAKGAGKAVSKGKSCASAIANVLQDILDELAEYDRWEKYELEASDNDTYENEEEPSIEEMAAIAVIGDVCPECGAQLNHTGGCVECMECGWTKCN